MHSEVARGKGLSEMVSTHSGAHNPYNLLESGEAFFDLPCLISPLAGKRKLHGRSQYTFSP